MLNCFTHWSLLSTVFEVRRRVAWSHCCHCRVLSVVTWLLSLVVVIAVYCLLLHGCCLSLFLWRHLLSLMSSASSTSQLLLSVMNVVRIVTGWMVWLLLCFCLLYLFCCSCTVIYLASISGELLKLLLAPGMASNLFFKKVLGKTQTMHTCCSKAEPKKFAWPQTPIPGAWDGQNLISRTWSLPLPTNPVWWGSMHAISSYRGNRPTTHKQTGPITIHCATASAQCNYTNPITIA